MRPSTRQRQLIGNRRVMRIARIERIKKEGRGNSPAVTKAMTDTVKAALENISAVFRDQPAKARAKNSPATATLESGLLCRVTGPHGVSIMTDMPVALGGGATAPNPGWFMRASLAACNATVIALMAVQRNIALKALEVTVSSETDARGMLGMEEEVNAGMDQLAVTVRITASGVPDDELRALVSWAISHSPVQCTDLGAASLHIEVQ